jgi:hypothetical protein
MGLFRADHRELGVGETNLDTRRAMSRCSRVGSCTLPSLAVAVAEVQNGEASRVERLQFGRSWRVCTARERQRDSTACHKATANRPVQAYFGNSTRAKKGRSMEVRISSRPRREQQVKNIARPVPRSEAHASPFQHGTGAGSAELLPASFARRFSDRHSHNPSHRTCCNRSGTR